MAEDIVALFIPIFGVLGLFTAIAFGIYYRYKTEKQLSQSIPADSLREWYMAKAQAREIHTRNAAFRWGGFLAGVGLGVAVGCFSTMTMDTVRTVFTVFIIIASALLFGGAGIIGAYFLQKRLDKKSN